ncbi:hypothetical protein [Lamprocystis purpurea]|nr:hypothetical protein [Lamprocystis purpurea]
MRTEDGADRSVAGLMTKAPKEYARPALNAVMLGELIQLVDPS